METKALDIIFDQMQELDVKGVLKPLLSYRAKLHEMAEKSHQELQKTLLMLSEYGELYDSVKKVQNLVQKAKEGKLSEEALKQPLYKTAKLSGEELLAIYKISHAWFEKKEFEKAAEVVSLLVYLAPEVSSFWRMLGSCYWNLDNPQAALAPFLYASMMDGTKVGNHVASLECLIKLGLSQEALNYYQAVQEVLSEEGLFEEAKPHLELVIQKL